MKWLELCIDTARDGLDKLEAMLSALGIDGIEIEDEADFQSFLAGNRKYWDYVDEDLLAQKNAASNAIWRTTRKPPPSWPACAWAWRM